MYDTESKARTITVLVPADLADDYASRASNPAKINRHGDTLVERLETAPATKAVDLTAEQAAYFLADATKPWPKDANGKSIRDYVAEAVKSSV